MRLMRERKDLCKVVLAGQSFVRLNNPIYKKLAGDLGETSDD